MTTPDPTPELKSIHYAESLGLNSVYDGALSARQELETKTQHLADLRNKRRQREQYLNDIEMLVIEDERAKHPSMSQTQMDKHLKVAFNNNGDIRETREELANLAGDVDLVEYEIELLHQDIKIAVARLHELGGYYQFMAVVKQANEARKSREARADGNPW
jgi:hypothetical protein